MKPSSAILLCGHGSRAPEALAEFTQFVHAVRTQLPGQLVEYGYLELAAPTIEATLEVLYERGIRDVAALPIMLLAAGHVRQDLPRIFESFRHRHEDMTIRLGRELGLDAPVVDAATERIRTALAHEGARPGESVLVVVGRGAAEANLLADVGSFTALLRERLGFAATITCYCGMAEPFVEAGLQRAAELGQSTVVVFPLLLFTGVLEQRVYNCVAHARTNYPRIRFLAADYLSNHPRVIEAFVQRTRECKMEPIATGPFAGTL